MDKDFFLPGCTPAWIPQARWQWQQQQLTTTHGGSSHRGPEFLYQGPSQLSAALRMSEKYGKKELRLANCFAKEKALWKRFGAGCI